MLRIARCTFALLMAAPLYAQYNQNIVRTMDYRGGTIDVSHSFGSVTIHGEKTNEVVVRATIHASDAAIGQAIRVEISPATASGVTIRTEYPSIHTQRHLSFSVEMELTVPERAPVRVTNRFGNVDVGGTRAPVDVTDAQGSVSVRDGRGTQRVENAFGKITVQDSYGDTTIQNSNGTVDARHIEGSLDISNRFGPVTVDRVTHNAVITNANGAVTATNVGGSTRNTTSFAPVSVRDVGALHVMNQNGDVTAMDIRGTLNVDSSFGLVRAERIHGALDVDNNNGGITASDIGGNARVRTSFGSVFLKSINGSIEVESQNGGIAVSALRGRCQAMSLKTSFATIKVGIPANTGYTVAARTSFGSVTTDVPIAITEKSDNVLKGAINGGGCKMDLATSNGGITLTRE